MINLFSNRIHITKYLTNKTKQIGEFALTDQNLNNLRGVDFSDSDLTDLDIGWTDLRGADLSRCKINSGTNFDGCLFNEKTKMPNYPMACPEQGAFIGWKKAFNKDVGSVIIELLIPEDAKRSSATGSKCRCDKAKVVSMTSLIQIKKHIRKDITEAISFANDRFIYRLGEWVQPEHPFDDCRWHECTSGIHFFMEKEDAEKYHY